jgi:hypothetical protein
VSPSPLHSKRIEESRKHRLLAVQSHPFSKGPNHGRTLKAKGSVSDPYSFDTDPGFDDQKFKKIYSWKKIKFIF